MVFTFCKISVSTQFILKVDFWGLRRLGSGNCKTREKYAVQDSTCCKITTKQTFPVTQRPPEAPRSTSQQCSQLLVNHQRLDCQEIFTIELAPTQVWSNWGNLKQSEGGVKHLEHLGASGVVSQNLQPPLPSIASNGAKSIPEKLSEAPLDKSSPLIVPW